MSRRMDLTQLLHNPFPLVTVTRRENGQVIAIRGPAHMDDPAEVDPQRQNTSQSNWQNGRFWNGYKNIPKWLDSSWSSDRPHRHIIKGILHVCSSDWWGMVKNWQGGMTSKKECHLRHPWASGKDKTFSSRVKILCETLVDEVLH